MTLPPLSVSSENAPFRYSKGEAMMEIIRDDLSRQKPSRWGEVRRKYGCILPRESAFLRASSALCSVSRAVSSKSRINHKYEDDVDLYDHRKRNMVRILKMMDPHGRSSRNFPKQPQTARTEDSRLPTRGSRLSLDPQMLSTSVHRRESTTSMTGITRRRSSIKHRQTSKRRVSIKQTDGFLVDKNASEQSTIPESNGKDKAEKLDSNSHEKHGSGRLKKLAKLLILLLRGWRLHSKKVHEILDGFGTEEGKSDTEVTGNDVLFDLGYYKVKKEEKVPSDIQQILRIRPKDRTSAEAQTIQLAFRNYRSIASYPETIQKMIAERAWYETYGPKKVMVREGHPPMRFYFILSGSAVVCVMDEHSRLKTIVHLSRGDPFGELAIINRSRRQSTVISQEQIELLCLTDQDFEDIFMSGGLNDPEDPFLRSLWYLENWPIYQIIEHPEKALISYFQRHTVLVPDSNASDWLYIIKSGSCEVMKSLKQVRSSKTKSPPKVQDFREQIVEKLRQEDPKYLSHEKLLHLKLEKQIEKIAQENMRMRHFLPEININTGDAFSKLMASRREPSEAVKRKPEREKSTLERLVSQKPHMGVSKLMSQTKEASLDETDDEDFTSFKDGLLLRQPGNGNRESRDLVRRGAINVKRQPQEYNFSKNSVLVAVGTLTKGEAFGLHELVYQHQPSMCLVSNGAEVVMINKKFYLEHASDSLIRKLRSEVIAFPTEHKLQSMLEADTTWVHMRKISLRQSVDKLNFKKVDVNDARSRYPKTNPHRYI